MLNKKIYLGVFIFTRRLFLLTPKQQAKLQIGLLRATNNCSFQSLDSPFFNGSVTVNRRSLDPASYRRATFF